jgi:hypothetical protein
LRVRAAGACADLCGCHAFFTRTQVREAQLEQYNYILVVGAEEMASRTVNVRSRDNVVHGAMQLDDVAVRLAAECASRSVHSAFDGLMAAGAEAHAGGASAAPAPAN